VDFINEHNRRRLLPSQAKDVPDHPRAFSQVLLHKLAPVDADKSRGRVMRNGLDQHRLSSSGWPVQEDPARRVDSDLPVEVRVRQWQLNSLPNLLLLAVKSSNIRITHVRSLHVP